jgi:preprotein translocase subunit YajC
MNLLSFFIPTAYAAGGATTAAPHQQGSMMSTIIMLVVFFAIFYFLLIRPQSKRAKAQRELIAAIKVGDEVTTTAGIIGTIKDMDQNIVSLQIAADVVIKLQKSAVTGTLPQGSVDSAEVK